ncbi:hypothetical protein BDQ94DRAFT_98028 [Aspergillus welwitschiae]|uniref:Uncharacterized protein n=1 Tax=Aspergillus welwitschiae TaxID=1341132 RepID=A0A3F3PNK0_9EURO|nr:hypothetical protein BDQ94DRAFT_98028 [Aspergillus welwitschiae]RDH28489.1 hypothetical protein BDQ94DRAFT_98028 [Aspergillus welwitschiae]
MAAMQSTLVFVCLGLTHIPSSFARNILLLQPLLDLTEHELVAFISNYAHSLLLVLYPQLGIHHMEFPTWIPSFIPFLSPHCYSGISWAGTILI